VDTLTLGTATADWNVQNSLPSVLAAVKKATCGRGTGAFAFRKTRIVTAIRSLTAACSTVELLRNGSLEF